MRLIRLPGVFRPPSDTWMLASVLRDEIGGRPVSALDLCTGTGALAVVAAPGGAGAAAGGTSPPGGGDVPPQRLLAGRRTRPGPPSTPPAR